MKFPLFVSLLFVVFAGPAGREGKGEEPPIYIAFHWHFHQPIYWPGEDVVETTEEGRYSFSPLQVHSDRTGQYTEWPLRAVEEAMNRGFPHAGAGISFSGSLMENLNAIEAYGLGFSGWRSRWQEAAGWLTDEGNPRVDLVNFPFFHPILPLIGGEEVLLQIEMWQRMAEINFGLDTFSKGTFPPENSFSREMIPYLKSMGIEWVLVDNIHMDRAHVDYPYSTSSNLYPPNPADIWNDDGTEWIQLNNLWAPSPVSAPFGYRPHYIDYIDPETGEVHYIIAVPSARYEGVEDARGGFGALLYEEVMSQYEHMNTDEDHPMLVVLCHDGDNYGAGVESYYYSNFDNFLNWLSENPDRFVFTTIQDYLDRFPPASDDIIHVEDGSWSGADNGDPEFLKWNGDPDEEGYSPDRNSWASIVAGRNWVHTAESVSPHTGADGIIYGGSDTDRAWRYLLMAETSCYWYWDYSEGGVWDSHPTRAANEAIESAMKVLGGGEGEVEEERVPPSIYIPQREPYNPGGYEWGADPLPLAFEVWTLVYDLSGIERVTLFYRFDEDGCRDVGNEVYDWGELVGVEMTPLSFYPQTDPLPLFQADLYSAQIEGEELLLIDYFVEAEDLFGNISRSPLKHLFVGTSAGGGEDYWWEPESPGAGEVITIYSERDGNLHWGVNGWQVPLESYWPSGTTEWGDGASVESPLLEGDGYYYIYLGPFDDPGQPVSEINFLFHYPDGSWSSPDETISIGGKGGREECIPYMEGGEAPSGDGDDTEDDDDDSLPGETGEEAPEEEEGGGGGCGCTIIH